MRMRRSQLPGAILATGCVLLLAGRVAPRTAIASLAFVATLWNLFALLLVLTTLAWFVYAVFLRRIFRAKRITAIRMRRLVREASEREVR